MRVLIAFLFVLLDVQPPTGTAPVPVLVELYTSEGCSSCPPADRVLSDLVRTQPVAGVQVIGLGLHVDYWDDLGWKDGASFHGATIRQQQYAQALGNEVYTPQAIVDGHDALIGSDASGLARAIQKAGARSVARLQASVRPDGSAVAVSLTTSDVPADAKEPLDAYVAVSEDDVTTFVKRGENSGRTLHHDAVVRALVPLGPIAGNGAIEKRIALPMPWTPKMHAVAFVQGRKTERIWGAQIATIR